MDQEFINEEQYEEGLTFRKVGYFFKKGWLRMLIYALVLVLLTTVIVLPIKVFYKSEPMAKTAIEFIYDGIERGLAPDGATLATDNIISTTVLASAVDAAELNDVITDISKLREKMRVEGEATEEYAQLVQAAANGDTDAANRLLTYTYYPTRFDIIISQPKQLGLSDDQSKLLLNKVVESYYADFQKKYSLIDMFSSDIYILSQNENIEFFNIYDTYVAALDEIDSYIDTLYHEDPTFTSFAASTTLTQLINNSTILRNQYEELNNYILVNNVWHNKVTAKQSLLNSIARLDGRTNVINATIKSLQDQIKDFQPNTTIRDTGSGTSVITTTYPSEYYTLQSKLTAAIEELGSIANQKGDLSTRIELLEDIESDTDEAYKKEAKTEIEKLEAQSRKFVSTVNAVIEDYYNTTLISSSVRQVLPATVTRRSMGLNIIIIYLAAIIGGVLVAALVTGIKISHANAARGKAEKVAEAQEEKKEESKE
ncbi:MAG: hypothetical protein HDT28_00990 [Clostridiales bacterium]|nr:hypothetical protein [Clostridiales bacterium]